MKSNNDFLTKMEDLVKQVVAYNNIPCYRIDSITETHTNTDGVSSETPVVRIVSIFEDTTSSVAHLLNSEFDLSQIVSENSFNDSFASSGLVYKASLKANRAELSEYKALNPQAFEIRISSILQDVYSAMETDLSKDAGTVPTNIKRDFYRVGAFLEMADIEFQKLRKKVLNAEGATDAGMPDVPKTERATTGSPTLATATANTGSERISNIESMDMSVDSFDSLAISIDNIENKNGYENDSFFDTVTPEPVKEVSPAPVVAEVPATPQPEETTVATVNEPKASTTEEVANTEENSKSEKDGDNVALNIDNVETFNMNVNGMIEKTTEIVRENSTPETPEAQTDVPHSPSIADFEDREEEKEPEVVDENSPMTEATLREYVANSKLVKEVDALIAERAGAKINDEIDIEGDVDRLRFLKVLTLKQLHDKIADNKEDIVMFAEKWIGKDNGGSFDSGICLFYLEYLLVGKKNDPAFSVEYVLKFISDNDYSARYIIPTYNSIRQTNEPSNFAHLTLK